MIRPSAGSDVRKKSHFALRWAFRAESLSSNSRRRKEMTRSVLAALVVLLIAAAPSSASGVQRRTGSRPRFLHRRPEARHRPVRGGSSFGAAARLHCRPGAEPGPRRGGHVRLSVRPEGLCRPAVRRPGRGPDQRPPRRLRRAGSGVPHARDPDSCDLGARSGRPARPASQQHLQLQPDGAGRSRLHHRHGHSRHPPAVHRQDRERLHGGERRERHE